MSLEVIVHPRSQHVRLKHKLSRHVLESAYNTHCQYVQGILAVPSLLSSAPCPLACSMHHAQSAITKLL